MSQSFTSDSLITSVKRWAMIPEDQNTFTSSDFLDIANEELITNVVPEILRLHEDFFLFSEEVVLESGKERYRIPHRAIGNKLRDVKYSDNNGNLIELTRLSVDETADYDFENISNRVGAFYVENQDIVLLSSGQLNSGSLVFSYYLRPNNLVLLEKVGVISAINTGTGEITLSSDVPEAFTSTLKYDFVDSYSPHFSLKINLTPTSVSSTSITFAAANLPDSLKVGDYVCISGQSPVPQIPADLHPYLARRVTMRCLEAIGDAEGVTLATQKAAEMSDKLTNLIDNRIEGAPRKVVNRFGHFRQRRRGF